MKKEYKPVHGMWTSRWVFILAATGSAVGLGNIWRFPYITGEYGGGAFVVLYLLCIALMGIPIMVAEVMLGRRGGLSPIHTMSKLAEQSKVTRRWAGIGYLGALSGFLILSFYSAVASWALIYVWEAAQGVFQGITAVQSKAHYEDMLANPWLLLIPAPLMAFGLGALFTLMPSMVADVVDMDELETGERREGMYGSIFWWVVKLGMAAALAAGGYLLNATGFDVALEGAQSAETIYLMRAFDAFIPAAASVVAIWMISTFSITEERAHEVRLILEERRGAA